MKDIAGLHQRISVEGTVRSDAHSARGHRCGLR